MTRPRVWLGLGCVVLAAVPMEAQRGCFHSPEAPTDVLLMVGSAGMFWGSAVLSKALGRRRDRRAGR